ncbi:MAG: urease accessory protein UreE [Sphingobacteriia bacterium]|nr:urease accessory protein UreE [Sphingobacteriia bacterium]
MNDEPQLLEVRERLDPRELDHSGTRPPALELVLDYESRQRSRLRASASGGRLVGLFLDPGTVLRDGDWLRALDGTLIRVQAAPERVSEVLCAEPRQLARAAYHLGNRHVALQVGEGWLRYPHDHVLDEMILALGLSVSVVEAPFEPEPGAYPGAHHEARGTARGRGHGP